MANVLETLSNDLAATVQAASPAVVRVEGRRRVPATGVIWSADGLIVTAHHVVRRDERITIGLPDGSTRPAAVVGRDPSTDLAVLRVEGSDLTPAAWASGDGLGVGQLVLALGRPGRSVQATLGIVSALGESWRTPAGGQIDRYLQTDVVMYPGFSGGPLVDASGQVIGLNTSALLRGVSVSIPAATVRAVVDTLLAHGHVRRGYLGVGAQPVRLPEALAGQIGQETGLLIASVEPGSPAESGGLMLGDTIVALDGHPMHHIDDLLTLLSGDRVGKAVPVRIVRGGQVQDMTVVIGERVWSGSPDPDLGGDDANTLGATEHGDVAGRGSGPGRPGPDPKRGRGLRRGHHLAHGWPDRHERARHRRSRDAARRPAGSPDAPRDGDRL